MPDTAGPRQHGITAPGDHRLVTDAMAYQPLDIIKRYLGDPASCRRGDIDNKSFMRDSH